MYVNILVKNENWFQLDFNLYIKNEDEIVCQLSTSRGRLRKLFSDLSECSKHRQTENLRKMTTYEELINATKSTLYMEGKRAVSDIFSQVNLLNK